MFGVPQDGKIVLVNRDFTIRIPYGAGYEVDDGDNEEGSVLTITRFDELPQNYNLSAFQPRIDPRTCDVINFALMDDEFDEDSLKQLNFAAFLGQLKRSGDEQFEWAAVGTAGQTDEAAENYRVLKIVQDTPEIKAGYITSDVFVATKFMIFIFTQNHGYRGKLKIGRQSQKFKRTEMLTRSLLSSVKPNTI